MSVFTFLFNLFDDEEALTEYANDPDGYTEDHLPEGMTSAEFYEGVQGVCDALPPEQAAVLRSAYGIDAPEGYDGPTYDAPPLPPAPPQQPGESDGDYLVRQINHYTDVVNVTNQHFEDNDTTTINDQDTTIDNSVNQEITAFGDVNQDFDNDVVTGDDNALGGDDSQVNSGDGAVQVGGNVTDATIATGDVEGSVTGDVYDSVVGDENQAIVDSSVGAAAFGEGDAINAENVAQDGSTIIDGPDGGVVVPRLVEPGYEPEGSTVNANTGDGTQTVVDDSTISESAVGEGNTVQSNDVDIDADDGGAVAYGEGSTAEGTEIDSYNEGGTTQIADDYATQQGATDNSVNDSYDVENSGNLDQSINDSYDIEDSFDATDSGNVDNSFNEDNDTTETTVEDDDLIDL